MAIVAGRVEQEILIDAPPDVIFDYFVQPALLLRWIGIEARLDPRPGGEFRCVMNETTTAVGHYTIVERPHRVAFTWGWTDNPQVPPGSSTVTVSLESQRAGTLVRLVHSDLPQAQPDHHDQGWAGYLPKLADQVVSGVRQSKP